GPGKLQRSRPADGTYTKRTAPPRACIKFRDSRVALWARSLAAISGPWSRCKSWLSAGQRFFRLDDLEPEGRKDSRYFCPRRIASRNAGSPAKAPQIASVQGTSGPTELSTRTLRRATSTSRAATRASRLGVDTFRLLFSSDPREQRLHLAAVG